MLQMMDEGRTPAHWSERARLRLEGGISRDVGSEDCIRIALINNMPDPALEDTEAQFFELLDTAAGSLPVSLTLFSLPGIPRTDSGKQHLANFYWDFDHLFRSRFDGVIITGTEPRQTELQEEPYWSALVDLFCWAEENTASAVLSCLAAHAAVLQGDGIRRRKLPDKQFGVFDESKVTAHPLLNQIQEPLRFPHSRWNEVQEEALSSCGYTVLTNSTSAGVNIFAKERKQSLFLHFQGHPEYGAGTLAKEFRRDIKRFLRGERQTYPTMPHGYFDAAATNRLTEFRERALQNPQERLMAEFPELAMNGGRESPWRSAAIYVYRNWLQYIQAKSANRVASFAVAPRRARVTWSR